MSRRPRLTPSRALAIVMALAALVAGSPGCKKNRDPETVPPKTPTLRLYVLATAAGALEPCGCQKDMLGGVDHAAALVRSGAKEAPNALVVAAGPMLFMDPRPHPERAKQDDLKAEALASSFSDLGLAAWAPGANDWALGAARLAELRSSSGAALLAANLTGSTAGAKSTLVVERGGHKIGLAGVANPVYAKRVPDGVKVNPLEESLRDSVAVLERQGAQIMVGLVAAKRGEALRLAERITGFDVIVVGKPYDRGEGNDAPTAPVLVGKTLVVQPPNHVQAIGIVDFYVRGDQLDFKDGSGLDVLEKRERLDRRIEELEKRLSESKAKRGPSHNDLVARRDDLKRLKAERAALAEPPPPKTGSFFRYRLEEVRESRGSDPAVEKRMAAFYERVNAHNKKVFKDRKPPPLEDGQAGYVGGEECSNCHIDEEEFWLETRHARAYATLEKGHKEFNLECVGCHVTGYEKPGGSTVTHVADFKNVQCETCHGPGSRHVETEDPKDIRRVPAKSECANACHHPPHVGKDWSVDDAWKKIIGPGHGLPDD